ncbi:type I-C CRISPR-associated protein Cas5c [Desulfovibrio inopinatus]|uniref:type I-C CRISPR-associated protein Cas5c n=1 Tax=Desulfovibrio inopinatus TaxID=102109 RepID=UPI000408FF4B|nr:type I-C CRISPR-associated protein Cas5c [Desulfovibrio inopinatus]
MEDQIVRVKASGPLACFSRPEMKVERVSYDIITPSAARGIVDSILWKPQMRWRIESITVLSPIRFQALKRNEVQSTIPVTGASGVLGWMKKPEKYTPQVAGAGQGTDGTPRNTLALRDVAYIIEARPIVFEENDGNNTPRKYVEMFTRRLHKGQWYRTPCFGCREFVARVEPPTGDEIPLSETRDLGYMLYDILFDKKGKDNRPLFFRAHMHNGVVDTRPETAITDNAIRKELLSCSYKP